MVDSPLPTDASSWHASNLKLKQHFNMSQCFLNDEASHHDVATKAETAGLVGECSPVGNSVAKLLEH